MQKINDTSEYETPEQIDKAEEYCINKSNWVL
jgi:hypothetical protein